MARCRSGASTAGGVGGWRGCACVRASHAKLSPWSAHRARGKVKRSSKIKPYLTVLGVLVERAAVVHGGRSSGISHCGYRWFLRVKQKKMCGVVWFASSPKRSCFVAISKGVRVGFQASNGQRNYRSAKRTAKAVLVTRIFSLQANKSARCRAVYGRRVQEGPEATRKKGSVVSVGKGRG